MSKRYGDHVPWIYWRIVQAGLAPTIRHVKDQMTTLELFQAHWMLDAQEQIQAAHNDDLEASMNRR